MTKYTLESIAAMALKLQEEKNDRARPTDRFSRVPLRDQHIAARCQQRAQAWFDANIAPAQELLHEMELQDEAILHYLESGAPEGVEMSRVHKKGQIDIKIVLKSLFAQLSIKRQQYLKEGLSTPAYKSAFGALCGRLEEMQGTKIAAGRLDLTSVTTKHYSQLCVDIKKEMDAVAEAESAEEPGESPSYTRAVDDMEKMKKSRKIGDASEQDTDDLLQAEWVEMDKLNAKLAKQA